MNRPLSLDTLIILPHLKCGGTERSATELANFIARNGGKVSLVLMFRKEIFYKTIPGVGIIEPDIDSEKWTGIIKFINTIRFIRSTIKRNKPEVVLALGYIAFTLFASIGLKTKVIISYRSNPVRLRFPGNRFLNSVYNLTHLLLKRRVNGIIAQTEAASQIYKRKYTCPVVSIPNFLRELEDYDLEQKNIIINVGHLTSDKAQHFLIKAFSMLNAPEWELLLVGEGPRHKELVELCKELKVDSRPGDP
jgi:GalNAc-alpha-(1->4)-GalNAc-alpha-(1->3)-diNAcBac-PP-undecaprenol alpha-1,4-N-acetyl-D-galactosaminyltransferase